MTTEEEILMRHLLLVAERNWQAADDEGHAQNYDLPLFSKVRDKLGLPRKKPRFDDEE